MIDFTIVSGGSTGSALADQLTKDPDGKVMLIKAGPRDWHPNIHLSGANGRPNLKVHTDAMFIRRTERPPSALAGCLSNPDGFGRVVGSSPFCSGFKRCPGRLGKIQCL